MSEQHHLTPGKHFPELGQLIQRILAAGETSIHYRYPNNKALVDVVIIADTQPRQLVALIVNRDTAQAVSIEKDILMPGYRIRTRLEDRYSAVLDALGVQKDRHGKEPFEPSKFFEDMIAQAPHDVRPATEADVLRTRHYEIDEADKIYYSHLMRRKVGEHPTVKNLAKTELAFGAGVRRFCERYRFSTCWRKTPPPGGIRSLADVRARIFARTDVEDEQ